MDMEIPPKPALTLWETRIFDEGFYAFRDQYVKVLQKIRDHERPYEEAGKLPLERTEALASLEEAIEYWQKKLVDGPQEKPCAPRSIVSRIRAAFNLDF